MAGLEAATVMIAIVLGILLILAFDIFCLVRLAVADRPGLLPKALWAVAILCVSPCGGALYLLTERYVWRSQAPLF